MRHLIFIGESLADEPLVDLGGRTPLEVARTPHMDRLAKEGQVGLVSFSTRSKPCPAAACLAILGYDSKEFY